MKAKDRVFHRAPWALMLILAAAGPLHAQRPTTAPDPLGSPAVETVARVNGEAISRVDLDREVLLEEQKLAQKGQDIPDGARAQLEADALDTLIDRMLLQQDSIRRGYRVEPAEVDKELASFRSQFSDEQSFRDTLMRFKHTPDSFRRDVERGMLVQKMIDSEIAPDTKVSEDDIQSFYEGHPGYFEQPEQVHVRHILIEVARDASAPDREAALEKIHEMQAKLARGEDFQALAREYSHDPSAQQGGDIGFISRGQTADPFDAAAFDLKPGQISGVVKTEFGYHLIQMVERKPAGHLPIAEVHDTIREYLQQNRLVEAVRRHLDGLRSVASIENNLPGSGPEIEVAPEAPAAAVTESVSR